MQVVQETRICSKDGMLMVIHQKFRADQSPGQPEVKNSEIVTVMDRQGKKRLGGFDDLKFQLDTKEQHQEFLELFEMLEEVVQKIRGVVNATGNSVNIRNSHQRLPAHCVGRP